MADDTTPDATSSDDTSSDDTSSEDTASEPTAVAPAPAAPAAAPQAPTAREPFTWSTGRVVGIVAIVLLLGAGVGLLIGRATADTGPTSLADAVHETANGDLPRGDLSAGDALGALGGGGKGTSVDLGDLKGALGDLFGKDTNSKDLRDLLGDLIDHLKGDASSGDTPTSPSTAPPTTRGA